MVFIILKLLIFSLRTDLLLFLNKNCVNIVNKSGRKVIKTEEEILRKYFKNTMLKPDGILDVINFANTEVKYFEIVLKLN